MVNTFSPSDESCTRNHHNDIRGFKRITARVLPLVLAITLTSCTVILSKPVYATIDDARLMYVYAGYMSGVPEPYYLFQNVTWSTLVSSLYSIVPAVNWYVLLHLTSLCIAAWALFSVVFAPMAQTRFRWFTVIVPCLAIWLVLFIQPILLLHFEVTASFVGSAGIAILVFHQHNYTNYSNRNTYTSVFGCLLMIVSFVQCSNSFYALFAVFSAYSLTDAFLELFKNRYSKAIYKHIMVCYITPLLIIVLCVLLLMTLHRVLGGSAWESYSEYNHYRVVYNDYNHPLFDDASDAYEMIGWSRPFFSLTERMYYMDSRFGLDSLSVVVEPFSRFASPTQDNSIREMFGIAYDMLKREPAGRLQMILGLIGVSTLFAIWKTLRLFRKSTIPIISWASSFISGVTLTLYLLFRGRLPLRAFEAVSIPVIFLLFVTLSECMLTLHSNGTGRNVPRFRIGERQKRIALLLLVSIVGMSAFPLGHQINRFISLTNRQISVRRSVTNKLRLIEEYAISHPESTFVYGTSLQNYGIDLPYSLNDGPCNLVIWGTSYYGTPVWEHQIHNGCSHTTLSSESFLDDTNVFFICMNSNSGREELALLYEMLNSDYGAHDYDIVNSDQDPYLVIRFH